MDVARIVRHSFQVQESVSSGNAAQLCWCRATGIISMLKDKIIGRESGILLYGLVPPKKGTALEKVEEIAATQVQRLAKLAVDGLILYDIQDEKARTDEARPFPFLETLDGFDYSEQYLSGVPASKVIYRSVGKYSEQELTDFLQNLDPAKHLTVFVGAASATQAVTMTMNQAYALKRKVNKDLPLGGVVIPERHMVKGNEHERVFAKIGQGCQFFVSQGVYDVDASRNFLSDYYYYAQEQGRDMVPIIFTLTPCGSTKTLEFMKWLGISIPRWMENDLMHAQDILQQSVDFCAANWRELKRFAESKSIPIGCNIESVAVRKVEVEASIELFNRVSQGR
jgi:hypothetical protein